MRKKFYGLKNALQLYYANTSPIDEIKKKLGLYPNIKGVIGEQAEKLTYRTEDAMNYQHYSIDHNLIPHDVAALQISNYICVDESKNPLKMVHQGYKPKVKKTSHGNILPSNQGVSAQGPTILTPENIKDLQF